jgi:ribokinase
VLVPAGGIPALCVGSLVCDISITGLNRFPVAEAEFSARSDIWHQEPARLIAAGTAGNAALACAALAGPTRLAGPVGLDLLGQTLRSAFSDGGVELAPTGNKSTGTHVIANSKDGLRQAYFYPGEHIELDSVPRAWARGQILFSGLNLAVTRPITPGVIELAEVAHANRGMVALDIGQAGDDMLSFDELAGLERAVDVLIGSRYEWGLVLGERPEMRMHRLRGVFPGHIVVKHGSDGLDLYRPGHRDPLRIAAAAVAARNPIGAGDAFAGGMLAAVNAGRSLEEACRWGSAAGAASVESTGGPAAIEFDRVRQLYACV